jgi:hypothetical protein
MLYADADIITTMKRVEHVDPFSFLEIKPVELFPSKDTTTATTATPTTTTTNNSFSLLSLESIEQKDEEELVVFNSTIFTTTTATNNKNLERSRSFCQSPLPFQYNSNAEDGTVEVKKFINARKGTMINAYEPSTWSSSSSSSSSSDSDGSSYYSFSDLSWDGIEPFH